MSVPLNDICPAFRAAAAKSSCNGSSMSDGDSVPVIDSVVLFELKSVDDVVLELLRLLLSWRGE